jgi:chitinase
MAARQERPAGVPGQGHPLDQLTHINYAFAHVDAANRISVGGNVSTNPAIGMDWPGVAGAELDPALPYKGHFNLLTKYKRSNPNVKTLISVGGWAETGGYFDDNGNRVDSGGFYRMTTNADNSVNTACGNAAVPGGGRSADTGRGHHLLAAS